MEEQILRYLKHIDERIYEIETKFDSKLNEIKKSIQERGQE